MKNVLFATTALIATAGIASADVSVGGYGYLGVTFDGSTNTTAVLHATRLTFAGSVETDIGVSFTAKSRITISNNNDGTVTADLNGATAASLTDVTGTASGTLGHNSIQMTSGGLTLTVGATHGAMRKTARVATFHGFDDGGLYYSGGGGGVDNANGLTLNDDGDNVLIEFASGDFKVAAATDVTGATQELGASYSFNNFTIGAAVASNNNFLVSAKYDGGAWNVALGTNNNSDIVLTAGYDISDATSIGFGVDAASGGKINAVGLQVSHDIVGANIVGAVGQVGGNTTVASLGVMFGF